jgi:hypothetical protein
MIEGAVDREVNELPDRELMRDGRWSTETTEAG